MSFKFLTADWRRLVMAQYEIDPQLLAPRIPPGLELDLFHGRCFVSLIGFLFDRVRILGVPVPGHTSFEEVNLRYYVRRVMPDGSARRGVVFLSEIVAKPAIVAVARALYGEAYSMAAMDHRWTETAAVSPSARPQMEIDYEWKHRGRWQRIGVRAANCLQPMVPGSMDEFITEHYWGYAPTRGGGTTEYAVEHARWEVYPVEQYRIACDFGSLYGREFAPLAERAPDHVLFSEGAPVAIRWGSRVA